MKICIKIVFLFGFTISSFGQITFNSCHSLFDNQDFILNQISTDLTGRHIFETIPIDGDQPCSGVGICEFRILWNDIEAQWELIADDGNGDFSAPFLIYSNTEASMPNPPSLNLGIWIENTTITTSLCGEILSLTGNVQDTALSIEDFNFVNDIQIYPNPASRILRIKSLNSTVEKALFYDLNGRKVLSNEMNVSQNIDVSSLREGVYFVQIISDSKHFIKKIIIK